VGARSGVAQIAADRSPALNLNASDQSGDFRERRIDAAGGGVPIDAITGNGGAEREPVRGVKAKLVQLGDTLDVDHQVRGLPSGPQLDKQVGASGQQQRLRVSPEQASGVRNRLRGGVIKVLQSESLLYIRGMRRTY